MTARSIASFVALQVTWFACVLGAAHGMPWLGPLVVLVALGAHLRWTPRARRSREVLVLALTALFGFLLDTSLLSCGVTILAGARVSPFWLVALWPTVAAATAPGASLGSLVGRPSLAALLGALSGPLAYAGGARLGAIALDPSPLRLNLVLALCWAPVLPGLFLLRRRVGADDRRG